MPLAPLRTLCRTAFSFSLRALVLAIALSFASIGWADVRFKGRLFYRESSGLALPIRLARINAYDENAVAIHSLQCVAYTDSLGNFDFTIPTRGDTGPWDSGLVDPYLCVAGRTNASSGIRLEVYGAGEETSGSQNKGYRVSSTYFDAIGTIDLGNVVVDQGTPNVFDANAERALQAYDAALQFLLGMTSSGFALADGFLEAGYWITMRPVGDATPSNNTAQYGSLTGYDWQRPRSFLNARDAANSWAVYRAMAFQQLFWWDYLRFSGNGTLNSRLHYSFLGQGVFPQEQDSFTGSGGQTWAWAYGFASFLASQIMGSTNSRWVDGSGASSFVDIEANWDGAGSANGNSDGASDAGSNGKTQPAAVAGLLRDLFDNSSSASDPFDHSNVPLSLLPSLFSGASSRLATAQAFIDEWTARGYESAPMVYGAAQIHGMTQNRIQRPTIGLTALSASGTPWFWNGPASGSMTVFNYGSQPFSNWNATTSLDLSLRSPSGAAYLGGPMLGTSANVAALAAGTARSYPASVSNIWPGAKITGDYRLQANCWFSDGSLRKLIPTVPGLPNPLIVHVGSSGVPPTVSVIDPGEYQVDRTSLAITVNGTGSVAPIVKYEVALGTTPGSTNVAAYRTITSSATSVSTTFTGLSVARGTRVYATARVTNGESLVGTASSDGIVLGDATPPACTVDDLGDFQDSTSSVTFRTTCADPDGALTKVEYCISSNSTFDGDLLPWTTYATYPVGALQRNVDLLVTRTGLSLPNARPFFIGVRWTNAEGYVDFALSDGKFVVNGTCAYGHVELEDLAYPENRALFPVTFTLSNSSGVAVQTETVSLLESGAYAFEILNADTVRVSAQVFHWLRQTQAVTVASGAIESNFSLPNGDCDEDNVVTVFDYAILSDAFDQAFGDPGYNLSADLDFDGTVSVFDYSILSANFDRVGDEP